jgi:hypothetical protein
MCPKHLTNISGPMPNILKSITFFSIEKDKTDQVLQILRMKIKVEWKKQ